MFALASVPYPGVFFVALEKRFSGLALAFTKTRLPATVGVDFALIAPGFNPLGLPIVPAVFAPAAFTVRALPSNARAVRLLPAAVLSRPPRAVAPPQAPANLPRLSRLYLRAMASTNHAISL